MKYAGDAAQSAYVTLRCAQAPTRVIKGCEAAPGSAEDEEAGASTR